MRILQIVDVPNWAIGELSQAIRAYNDHLDLQVLYVPPRDIDKHIDEVRAAAAEADLIDFQYWNVARQLVDKIPALKGVPKVLTHHNQKNLLSADWSDFELLCCKTQKSFDILNEKYPGKVRIIPNTVNVNYFKFNDEWDKNDKNIGYVGRICPWKGLKEIGEIGLELKVPVSLMGKEDKMDYWLSISEEVKRNFDYSFFNCQDGERPEYYKQLYMYVGNSGDGREEGTLGFLEAMASGVPIVTTPSGMAADLGVDGENMLIVPFEDKEALKQAIQRLLDDKELCQKLRKNAWQTIKAYTHERMALSYTKVWYEILGQGTPLASVIIPSTYDRREHVSQILKALERANYPFIEAVVVWDEVEKAGERVFCPKKKCFDKLIVKEVWTKKEGYNLAMARNLGIIEAMGDVLIFNDSRLEPNEDAINIFVEKVLSTKEHTWFFGDKGGGKRNFVENFSAIRREYMIKAGMFNERITEYGGMSQELRSRFEWQGFNLEYVSEARAKELRSSKLSAERRASIVRMKNLLSRLGL